MSVFSNFTATTARPDRPTGRLFKSQGLLGAVPEELLHPKPAVDDDDEARIYVDTKDLTRVGCFSGDWVRMEAAEEPPLNGFGSFGLGSFGNHDVEEEANWRPVRIFALPEGYSQRPVSRIPSSRHDGNRRPSFFESQMPKPSSPAAYLSPVLLANLENSPYLRLSPLKRTSLLKGPAAKLAPAFQPPPAREVTLQQVRTPVTADREVQTAVMAGLKLYFENKLRVIRAGDLIAVPIDTQLGRTLQERTGGGESVIDDLLSLTSTKKSKASRSDEVAWFKISHVQATRPETEDPVDEDIWASVASVDPSIARIEQTGSVTSRVPGTADSNWQYYLGLKKPPRQTSTVTPPMTLQKSHKFASPLRRRLRELMAAATSKQAIHFKMPALAILLVSTQRQIGKAKTAVDACADIGLHTFTIDSYDILNEGGAGGSDVKTEGFLRSRVERALSCGPDCCSLLVRHIEALTADRMVSAIKEILADARVFIATTTEVDKIPDGVRGLFTHEIEMNAPDEGEREGILRTIVEDRNIPLDPEVDLSSIALKTAALVAGDLVDVVERAIVAQQSRLETLSAKASTPDHPVSVRDIQLAGGPQATTLTKPDFETAVDAARKNFADAIGAPKIPNVTWDDVGGLNNVKDAVKETIQLPLERPELFAKGMKKRSGILFYGPPGTGKTLLAKAIATEYSLNFFSVKGPELLNMYIGESEANVRRVFQRARDARPCVVFFDELDSVAPKRGNQGDSGGVMDRIVSQLLAELDGMSGGDDGGGGVFVIGATNRPDLLDQALLRPGRFDKMLYLGVSDTHEKQLRIMEALTRKYV
jgi:peroxin-6